MSILGIDIGGTSIKAALVNTQTGEIVGPKHRIPTPDPCRRKEMLDAVGSVVAAFGHAGPVGVGFPGVIRSGIIGTAANLNNELVGMDIAREMETRLKLPKVGVVNDADAAGLAESTFGRVPKKGFVILLTLGTGIGGALISDGRLVPNFEPARFRLRDPGNPIGPEIDAEALLSAVNRERRGMSWEEWARRFGDYLEELHAVLQPDHIILGGGGASGAGLFMPLLAAPCPITLATFGNDAGIIGAALAAR